MADGGSFSPNYVKQFASKFDVMSSLTMKLVVHIDVQDYLLCSHIISMSQFNVMCLP